MSGQQKALLIGAVVVAAIMIYVNPRCNRVCKALLSGVIRDGLKLLA